MASPLMFESSDEESCEGKGKYEAITVKTTTPLPNDSNAVQLDNTKRSSKNVENIQKLSTEQESADRLRDVLKGVPPPPAITVCQLNATELLDLYNNNVNEFHWVQGTDKLLKNHTLHTWDWPDVKQVHSFGLSYNRCLASEEYQSLLSKFQERYIGSETSTSVNSFFKKSPIRTASAKKRARRHAWGHSPGRRLSHLARRRNTFSSANLQQNVTKSLPDKKKMILVERKKAQAAKRSRNSATKSSAVGKVVKRPTTTCNTKRALFQSPENEKKAGALGRNKMSPQNKCLQRSRRALWPDKPEIVDKENGPRLDVNLNGKHVAEPMNSVSAAKKKCFRNLSFSEDKKCVNEKGDQPAMPSLVPLDLNPLHRQKLLWAVSNALRSQGIRMEHNLSKFCVTELFRLCKDIWLKKYNNESRSGSTSDRMLELANKFANDVVRKAKARFESLNNKQNALSKNDSGNVTESSSSSCSLHCNDVVLNSKKSVSDPSSSEICKNEVLCSSKVKMNDLCKKGCNATYFSDVSNDQKSSLLPEEESLRAKVNGDEIKNEINSIGVSKCKMLTDVKVPGEFSNSLSNLSDKECKVIVPVNVKKHASKFDCSNSIIPLCKESNVSNVCNKMSGQIDVVDSISVVGTTDCNSSNVLVKDNDSL